MEFQLPQFVERQPKIIWSVTFRQFIFLALVAGGLALLYLILPNKLLFSFVAVLTALFAFLVVFVKIGGRPFSTVLWNFFRYTFSSRLYLWQRKAAPPQLLKRVEITPVKKPGAEIESPLKIVGKSYLQQMAKRVETGS